jgi:hypothetical protein
MTDRLKHVSILAALTMIVFAAWMFRVTPRIAATGRALLPTAPKVPRIAIGEKDRQARSCAVDLFCLVQLLPYP